MTAATYRNVLIVGAGSGLSASLARLFAREGMTVALAARDPDKLKPLCEETGAAAYACDAEDEGQVARLFRALDGRFGSPDVAIYNASARARGPLVKLAPDDVRRTLMVSAFGGFLVAQRASRAMLAQGSGAVLLPGPPCSV